MLDITQISSETGTPGRVMYACLFMWTVIAVVAATTVFIAIGATTWNEWFIYLYNMLAYFYTWGLLAGLIYWLTGRLPFEGGTAPAAAATHFSILLTATLALPFLLHPITWRDWLYGEHAVGFHALNAFIYAFVLIACLTLRYFRMSRTREREALTAELRNYRLEKDLSEARVNALRSQINPHFLFNTLNSISSLIETSSDEEAVRVTGLLGSLLRIALYETDTVFHSLKKELDFLERYVAIEQTRFAEKFRFASHVDPECLQLNVPSLFLQPLVENAVKYAVSGSSEPTHVTLQVMRVGEWIAIEVSDDGPGLSPEIERPAFKSRGVGLSNVRERLALLYKGKASLEIENGPQGGVSVRLRLPVISTDAARRPEMPAGIPAEAHA